MEYIIGVDIGTTSTKSIAFDLKGIAESYERPYPKLKDEIYNISQLQ